MMIREATHADVDALVELGRLMHAESPRFSRLKFSAQRLAATLDGLMAARPLGFLWVSCDDRGIRGGLAAVVARHWCSHDQVASDLALFMRPDARGGLDVPRLVWRYRTWAQEQGAVLVQLGVTTGVHTEATVGLYQRMGMERCGAILEFKETD